MEKKNLDKLFQKEFEGFEAKPDDNVWAKIEASLDKKKKKRVIPIWWSLGGAAALLAILMYVFIPNEKLKGSEEQIISDTNTTKPKVPSEEGDTRNSEIEKVPFGKDTESNPLVETNNTKIKEEHSGKDQGNGIGNPFPALIPSKELTNTQGKREQSAQSLKITPEDPIAQVALVTPKPKAEIGSTETKGQSRFSEDPIQESGVAATLGEAQSQGRINDNTVSNSNPVVTAQGEGKEVASVDKEKEKQSIFDAIAEQENSNIEKEEQKSYNRWAMGPSVAPVYSDASGEGSPIHSNFTQNSKSGNLNLSYGLTVSYNVSKKLSVRSGVHRVDFGYDTNEISFSSSLQAPTSDIIDNINYSQSSRTLVVRSNVAGAAQEDASNSITAQEFSVPSNLLNGRMVQQLGYVEVPVELNYSLLDKKIGINIIGGVSSLFLVDNSVSLESEGLVTNLGSANNVNDVNFSTNIGLGVNYKFTQNIQLNVEPVFKYQLNTFSDTAGSFRPYTVGVYSGVQFKF